MKDAAWVLALGIVGCGPRVVDPASGATEGEAEGSTSAASTGVQTTTGASMSTDAAEVDASVSVSTSSTSEADDGGNDVWGTGYEGSCDECVPDEICLGVEHDLCTDTTFTCVPIPPECRDDRSCANEACVQALCGWGGYCYDSCGGYPDEAFMCVANTFVCHPYAEQCAPGEKCTYGGNGEWGDPICVPLVRDPSEVGEPCTRGEAYDGLDSCTIDAFCWNVDIRTGLGTCVSFCAPSDAGPVCEGGSPCVEVDVMPLCLEPCEPGGDACAPGNTCTDVEGTLVCLPDDA
jgi:hypothetical protein